LFDIDGTILHGGKLWRECFEGAMLTRFGNAQFPRISFSGKTDRQICRELMEGAGLGIDEPHVDAVIADYLSRVRRSIGTRSGEVKLLPGVRTLLDELKTRSEAVLGLLTGNVREGAQLKLSAVAMEHYFKFGAYGDDHWNRYELPAIAVKRAKTEFGHEFSGKQIVIIGDTVHDVNCGRSLGVRAIGVGTGQGEQRALILEAGPDFFFEDLSDTRAVVSAILS
jgi:phosphoglycolate phosphatase